ncbi:MAG TPA: hypothetical protein EYP10_12395 [Armatimonadetes bacterium]|nr:hypothetical protein [Armatimonadota bacterium]
MGGNRRAAEEFVEGRGGLGELRRGLKLHLKAVGGNTALVTMRGPLLSEEDRELLLKVSNLLEEILETLEVAEDEELVEAIEEAEEDVEAGRVRSYEEFIEELRSYGEI